VARIGPVHPIRALVHRLWTLTPRAALLLETVGHGGILAGVWESGSSFARMTTHAMRPHEWGTRGMGWIYVWATRPYRELLSNK
jgi:hypothetical protein